AKTEQQARRAISAQREWESGNRRQLRLALPRARIVELPQASHYVFISDADHVEREIRTFLGGGQW
ncbi:MAG TPA: hypothetical protein VM076_15920, partial [Gemmatimonadaceae bacterium]|nr:hypothetical protein [Gemmatimonadaceae bacterium]